MIRLNVIALVMTLVAGISTAHAELATWFEVEVAVFERPQATSETWPERQAPVKTSHTLDLLGPAMMPDLSSLQGALSDCDPYDWQNTEPCEQPAAPVRKSIPSKLPTVVTASEAGDPLAGEPFLLGSDELEFTDALATLRRQGMTVKLHSVWKQPVYSRPNSRAYRMYNGRNFAQRFLPDGHLRPAQGSAFSQFNFNWPLVPYSGDIDPVWELDGWLRIYLDHFLYIDTQLQLREEVQRPVEQVVAGIGDTQGLLTAATEQNPVAATVKTEPFLSIIQMKQSRRVRSREIHYFDHPRLGMVIQIRRMPQPPAE